MNDVHELLRRLHMIVRGFCPTWEEWQTTVDLYPVADGAGLVECSFWSL